MSSKQVCLFFSIFDLGLHCWDVDYGSCKDLLKTGHPMAKKALTFFEAIGYGGHDCHVDSDARARVKSFFLAWGRRLVGENFVYSFCFKTFRVMFFGTFIVMF